MEKIVEKQKARTAVTREEPARQRKRATSFREKKAQSATIRKSSYCREGKITEGEAPEKVQRANNVRWKECAKMAKVERKLAKRLREDPGQRPVFPEPSLPINLQE